MSYLIPKLGRNEIHQAEQMIQRSRFIVSIGYAATAQEAEAFIVKIKEKYADATHNCSAFCIGKAGAPFVCGASDDGEPKGTAGRPMLTVLEHGTVGDIVAVVTRYYGGILLGTGGLVRAYQGTLKLGLETLPTKPLVPMAVLTVQLGFAHYDHFVRIVADYDGVIVQKEFSADVRLSIEIPQSHLKVFSEEVNRKLRITVKKND